MPIVSSHKTNVTRQRINNLLKANAVEKMLDTVSDEDLDSLIKAWFTAKFGEKDERKDFLILFPDNIKNALIDQFKIDLRTETAGKSIADRLFSMTMEYLARKPERISLDIYNLLLEHKTFHWVVSLVNKKQDGKGNVYLVPSPVRKTYKNALEMERVVNIQNMMVAKVEQLLKFITAQKMKEAPLGVASKAMRDMLAAIHVLRLDFSPDSAMEATYKETTVDGKTTKERMVRYVDKSKSTWNSK